MAFTYLERAVVWRLYYACMPLRPCVRHIRDILVHTRDTCAASDDKDKDNDKDKTSDDTASDDTTFAQHAPLLLSAWRR